MPTQVVQAQPSTNAFLGFLQFWKDVKAVAQPYWYPHEPGDRAFSEVIRSWGMLILLILLIIALVGANVFNSFINRYLADIIIKEKEISKFYDALLLYGSVLVLGTLLAGFSRLVRKKIALDWYQWLNNKILSKYLNSRAYYKINFKSSIDNPDQRLSQEIEPIASNALSFSATLLEKILEMSAFLLVLWSISQSVALILVSYTVIGNLIAVYLTQELNKINREELEAKAEYTYCLTHLRTHAESVAFFRGEKQESNIIARRFSNLIKNAKCKIDWEKNSEIFNRGYQSVIQIFPYIVFGPLQIRGEMEFGEIIQASVCCYFFANALGDLINEFGNSGRFSSYVERLSELWNAGTGRLVRPPLEEVLFLPQRPYIILGTLREQLLYPNTNRQMTDVELKAVLQQVNLQNLLSRVDGFDTEVPWENILSIGEQQRLAFARLLVTHPSFTILDEATSALDLKNEASLYQQLQSTKTTFISVGHRESLFDYHQWVLELSQDSSWQLVTIQDYRNQKVSFTKPPTDAQIKIDDSSQDKAQNKLEISTSEKLTHKEMNELTYYSLSTIRSKASKGESITTRDGVSYGYDKDPKVLKWSRL